MDSITNQMLITVTAGPIMTNNRLILERNKYHVERICVGSRERASNPAAEAKSQPCVHSATFALHL